MYPYCPTSRTSWRSGPVRLDREDGFEQRHDAETGQEPPAEVRQRDAAVEAPPRPRPVALAHHLRVEEQIPGRHRRRARARCVWPASSGRPSAACAASRAGRPIAEPGERHDGRHVCDLRLQRARCRRTDRTAGRSRCRPARRRRSRPPSWRSPRRRELRPIGGPRWRSWSPTSRRRRPTTGPCDPGRPAAGAVSRSSRAIVASARHRQRSVRIGDDPRRSSEERGDQAGLLGGRDRCA